MNLIFTKPEYILLFLYLKLGFVIKKSGFYSNNVYEVVSRLPSFCIDSVDEQYVFIQQNKAIDYFFFEGAIMRPLHQKGLISK